MRWEIEPPLANPCSACGGSGSEWKLRTDGQPDRRYFFPIGPCRRCNGTRQDLCAVCGVGPNGRCNPPDTFDGECPTDAVPSDEAF